MLVARTALKWSHARGRRQNRTKLFEAKGGNRDPIRKRCPAQSNRVAACRLIWFPRFALGLSFRW
jgi:hypothetical protein